MTHDFVAFPELTNSQMQLYYFESPHKQIFEDIQVEVVQVHDGDTITVMWSERDFKFPVRFSNISARELSEDGKRDTSFQLSMSGKASRDWLANRILGKEVTLKINPKNRVEKFGRLLAEIIFDGTNIGEEAIFAGASTKWENRNDGKIMNTIKKEYFK